MRLQPDQLDQIDDTPRTRAYLPTSVTDLLGEIATLRESAPWAVSTLDGIAETIQRTGAVSPGQRRAVHNITRAVAEQTSRAADRAYVPKGSLSRRWEGPPSARPGHCRICRRPVVGVEFGAGVHATCAEIRDAD